MCDDFSPPLEGVLRREDSNQSWRQSQGSDETRTDVPPVISKDKLFLVSLGTLMALFS
jgi:hypothetical protein